MKSAVMLFAILGLLVTILGASHTSMHITGQTMKIAGVMR
jgi:hypothetical protein